MKKQMYFVAGMLVGVLMMIALSVSNSYADKTVATNGYAFKSTIMNTK